MGDLISDALSSIMNAEKINKREVVIKRNSRLLLDILNIIKSHKYISGYDFTQNDKGGLLKVSLINKINNIGSIRPRYPCTSGKIEDFEKVFLPAIGFGIMIISTSQGLMTHAEAKKKGIGGTLIAYCY